MIFFFDFFFLPLIVAIVAVVVVAIFAAAAIVAARRSSFFWFGGWSLTQLVGLIALAFPGAPIVHCTRDVRDTVLSNYQMNYEMGHRWSYNLTDAADYFAG
jgi:hypothetical protein